MSIKCNGDHKIATTMRYNLVTLSIGDIARFKIIVSVCLGVYKNRLFYFGMSIFIHALLLGMLNS